MKLICRTCMQVNEKYVNVFNYYENSKILSDMLTECTTIKVHKNDGLPLCICVCCLEKLSSAWNFRIMVIETDLKLRKNFNKHEENLVQSNNSFIDTIIVKEEYNTVSEANNSVLEENVDGNKSTNFTQDGNQEETVSKMLLKSTDSQHSSDKPLNKIIRENFLLLKSCVKEKNISTKEVDEISKCSVEVKDKVTLTNDDKHSTLPSILISSDDYYGTESLANKNSNKEFDSNIDQDNIEEVARNITDSQEDTYIKNELKADQDGDISKLIKDDENIDEYFNNSDSLNEEVELYSVSRNRKLTKKEKEKMSVFCKTCNRSFAYRYYFEVHVKHHNGDKQCKCEVCGKTFVWQFQLRVHMAVHSDARPFSCEVCGKTFKTLSSTIAHKAVHSDDTSYICNICQKSFKSKPLLRNHLQRHGKTFTCEVCGKSFGDPSGFNKHKFSHIDEKNAACTTCGKKFKTKQTLREHMKTHSEARPYSCSYCDKRFKTKDVMDSHVLIHTGETPYSCRICDKSFRHSATLYNHMRIHTGETPYSCKLCQSQFKYSHHLQNHMKMHK